MSKNLMKRVRAGLAKNAWRKGATQSEWVSSRLPLGYRIVGFWAFMPEMDVALVDRHGRLYHWQGGSDAPVRHK
jgi:hypothetical protein